MNNIDKLYKEINMFLKWADKYYHDWSEENDNGEWEMGFDNHFSEMCEAAVSVISECKCENANERLIDALLFVIARDNECKIVVQQA